MLLSRLEGEPLAEPNHIRFKAGRRVRAWEKNVVGIGLSGGFLEPLESTAIHLVQSAVARLMTLFPTRDLSALEVERFNRESTKEYVDIRDFLVLHYKATERDDSPFWIYCRALEPPPGLMDKLAMFRSSGRVFREHNELFTETSWLAVMVGQGIQAGGYHPAADIFPEAETLARLEHIRDVIAKTVAALPTQTEFLAANGALAASLPQPQA
jgi:tryptophan halogenase